MSRLSPFNVEPENLTKKIVLETTTVEVFTEMINSRFPRLYTEPSASILERDQYAADGPLVQVPEPQSTRVSTPNILGS